jgi:hypothetical protein
MSILSTIEADVQKGLDIAGPFLTAAGVIPGIGPILSEIGSVITNLENGGHTLDGSLVSEITKAITLIHAAKIVPPKASS